MSTFEGNSRYTRAGEVAHPPEHTFSDSGYVGIWATLDWK